MKNTVFAYSRTGCATALKVMRCMPNAEWTAYAPSRLAERGFLPIGRPANEFYGEIFGGADAMVFIGSCGIAVREIAPHIKDKRTDPAVICIDERGRFVIPILSGHIGGANELAAHIAKGLGATAVITTATDINNKFSVDAWAAKNGYIIDSMPAAKAVSAAILEKDIPLYCDLPIVTDYPSGVIAGDSGEIGICISWQNKQPFKQTLRLIPPVLHLGIGCRRGTSCEAIDRAVQAVLQQHNIDIRAVKCVSSIDLKQHEPGLLQYCADNGWQARFYSAQQLMQVRGEFTPSEFVRTVTGVDNVCERAALIGADKLIVRKTAADGVTVAVAAEKSEVRFG